MARQPRRSLLWVCDISHNYQKVYYIKYSVMATESSSGCSFNMEEATEICSSTLKTPLCKHKTETSLFISRTKTNPGKKFFCCPYWKVDNCGYWKWVQEGSHLFEAGKSVVIEIEELKKRIESVETVRKENSILIGIEVRKIKKAKKELIEEIVNMKFEIFYMKNEMQRMKLGMDELGCKAKANAKWKLLAIVIGFVLLAYILPSYNHRGFLSLPL